MVSRWRYDNEYYPSDVNFGGGRNCVRDNSLGADSCRRAEPERGVVPGDGSKYTITFQSNGRVVARVDCNRGSSTWKSSRANELQFGSWSMTRAKCPAGSLHDRIVTEGANVRSYSIKDGHLFLSGMSGGGSYELERLK